MIRLVMIRLGEVGIVTFNAIKLPPFENII
jgi:hypothetical protein